MVSIGSGIEQSVILFIAAVVTKFVAAQCDAFSARELLIVTFFGFVRIWLLSQELTGRVLSYVGILMLCVGKCITDIAASVYAAVNIARV